MRRGPAFHLAAVTLALVGADCAHEGPAPLRGDDEAAVWEAVLSPDVRGSSDPGPTFVRDVTSLREGTDHLPDVVGQALELDGAPGLPALAARLVEVNRVPRVVAPARDLVLTRDQTRADGACVYSLSRPAFGGPYALVRVLTTCGPRCGGETYWILERGSGAWKVRRRIRAITY